MIIKCTAPTRIDICGGTLDLWPLHQLIPQSVTVNVGVTLNAEVRIKCSSDENFHIKSQDQNQELGGHFRELTSSSTSLPLIAEALKEVWRSDWPALTIATAATSPAGAGLGGSSCLLITLLRALYEAQKHFAGISNPDISDDNLANVARDIEARIIHAPTGVQDYWGAIRGRVNILSFPAGKTHVETLAPSAVVGLEEQLILCFSGKSRASATNNWQVFKAVMEGNPRVIQSLERIAEKASMCAQAVAAGDLGTALLLSKGEWEERKKLWPDITTQETVAIENAALAAGASFSRVCGAGGGGVMAIFAPPQLHSKVTEAVTKAGGLILDGIVSQHGLQCFHEDL